MHPISNFSKNGQQALFGMQNGQVRIQNLIHTYDISELGPYWCLSMHDNFYGHITGLMQSYDETMLISTGADGNFFLYSYMDQAQLDKKIAENKAKLPSARVSRPLRSYLFNVDSFPLTAYYSRKIYMYILHIYVLFSIQMD